MEENVSVAVSEKLAVFHWSYERGVADKARQLVELAIPACNSNLMLEGM